MKVAESEIQQLTLELRKLRQAIERNQRALMNAKDAALYLGYSGPIFRRLVAHGVIPQTKLGDLEARYATAILDQIIANATTHQTT